MQKLFWDPDSNAILAAANMWPMTIGEFPDNKNVAPTLGVVFDMTSDGRINSVQQCPITFSLN
jgi:hypothetical protein